ncbi:hypothetical protein RHSIM_Rhsim03G0203000 [Rhododendron simsii]|uniref:non-specific serine/threonine protein kinase n=1 Tax=Rhododendron simsii TaxID=118357 RepID=A0A834LUD5_RHOSS|nr:hypothetical protein RHSIM_Rhsim03G0203000 [Rhododendron simsii]
MSMYYFILFFILRLSTAHGDCTPTRCSDHGPTIRFPFRLKNRHPPNCGYPGFNLSCSPNTSATLLDLPYSVQVIVTTIDYKSQLIHIIDPNSCSPQQLQNLNLSTTPFQFAGLIMYDFSVFSCPSSTNPDLSYSYITNLDLWNSIWTFENSYLVYSVRPYLLYPMITCLGANGREVRVGLNSSIRQKIIERKEHLKIERFLEDYRALKPARYSYANIKKITNQFKDKVGQGGYGTVYKGQLSNDVHVAVKILNNTKDNGEEFINEVGIIGTIHHVNVVRLVGYCAEGFRRALIYEFLPNHSLEKFALSDHKKRSLGWKKLLEIAMGIAKGIEYLHQGCDQQFLQFDIKPHNILLDDNLNPKISDLGQAKLCSKEQSIVSMTTARGTIGYIAPEVFSRNFENVSYKPDIYSFGMLLLEMV